MYCFLVAFAGGRWGRVAASRNASRGVDLVTVCLFSPSFAVARQSLSGTLLAGESGVQAAFPAAAWSSGDGLVDR